MSEKPMPFKTVEKQLQVNVDLHHYRGCIKCLSVY